MEIECRFFATFREAVGQKILPWELDEDATVGELLRTLEAEYDDLDGMLIEDGEVRAGLSILKNGRDVVHMDGTETPLADGDEVSVFPPVAGGSVAREERSFRGISQRLAVQYLEGLGGERTDDDVVEGDGWTATLSADTVGIGSSLTLTEVTIVFEGEPEALDELIPVFRRKAMRAGG